MRRIEICGGIASGKTTLAGLFQRHTQGVILEDYSSNPYWERFYQDPQRYAFETEIIFLIQHYSLIKQLDPAEGLVVLDFSPLQDMAYADVNLSEPRRRAFEGLFQQVMLEVGEPDILAKLECGPEEELKRVRSRGRGVESSMQLSYLGDLNRAIAARVARVSPRVRVVTIDSEANDFAHERSVQTEVVKLILAEAAAT